MSDDAALVQRLRQEVNDDPMPLWVRAELRLAAEAIERLSTVRFAAQADAEADRDEWEAEVVRLRAAIVTHRANVWGDGAVGHDEDVMLYAALREPPDA